MINRFYVSVLLFYTPFVMAVEFHKELYESHRYVVVTVDLEKEQLRQFWKSPLDHKPFSSINNLRLYHQNSDQQLVFAINSGIYTTEFTPLGLYIEKSVEYVPLNVITSNQGKGNFSLLPNGVFYIDQQNRAFIKTTQMFSQMRPKDREKIVYATQSGPMLLIDGRYHSRFIPASDSYKIRSGVCAKNNQAQFVVTEEAVNLYEFASFFKGRLQCLNALYLDGTITRLYYKGHYYGANFWKVRPYVGIWAVLEGS